MLIFIRVYGIGEQIGESFLFHRLPEILDKTITALDGELKAGANPVVSLWMKFQRSLFKKELNVTKLYEAEIEKIDDDLYQLEELHNPESVAKKKYGEVEYLGVLIFGKKSSVEKLTDKFKLWKK